MITSEQKTMVIERMSKHTTDNLVSVAKITYKDPQRNFKAWYLNMIVLEDRLGEIRFNLFLDSLGGDKENTT